MTHSPLINSQQNTIIKMVIKMDEDEDIRIRLGCRVKYFRNKQDLSQEELALRSDIDRTYLASVEKGRRNISIINIEKICKGLCVSLDNFFSGDDFK